MRGKAVSHAKIQRWKRITPAYAGKRKWQTIYEIGDEDHPRLCGEKQVKVSNDGYVTGSPPPMRGKESDGEQRKMIGRITPAYAGKRKLTYKHVTKRQDHPRLCGEKEADVQFLWHSLGSPPPMRGKAFLVHHSSPPVRITPAYAGKRNGVCFCRIVHKDHPRLCGEKEPVQKHEADVQGSPPPMRGKVHTELHCGILVRITPAYAGKSRIPITQFLNIQDHPRLCGEKVQKTAGE